MKSVPEIIHDNSPRVYEIIFRETVAYHFYVKAPTRKAASLWADKHMVRAVNANISRQVVEERGVEELFVNPGAAAEFAVNEKGNKLPNKKGARRG